MTEKTHVFISYSRNDYDFVVRLRQALDKHGIQQWIDQKDLRAGTPSWEQALRDAIKAAYAVIYVGSEDARKSPYVRDEIALATAYKANIFPIWADGKEWIECVPLGYGGWQYVDLRRDNFEHNFNKLLVEIKKETSDIIVPPPTPIVLSAGETPRNPYKGLNAFTGKDVADFFGRDELVNQLLEAVKGRVADNKDRLLTVIGASGSGKSSVVMAGLLPKLQAGALTGSADWTYLKPMVPGDHPVQALANMLYSAPRRTLPNKVIDDDLQHPNGMGLLTTVEQLPKHPVVLYIDQFEELFMTGVPEDERQQFISLLTYAVTQPDSPVLAILTLRADFYDRPMNYPELGRLVQGYNRSVLPMSIADLRDTVEKPAAAAGLSFEAGLVADIIFDLRDDKNAQAGALPLLQYTLEQLFERRTGNTLTTVAYKDIGGVKGAIGAHAEEVFKTLDAETQGAFPRVFQALVHVDERGTPTRKRETQSALKSTLPASRLVDALVKRARILRVYTEKLEDIPYVEVAHEALLTSWQRLSDWIKSADSDLRLIQEMKASTIRWVNEGRPKHRLWSHELLQPVYQALNRLPQELNTDEQTFIQPEAERLLEDFKYSLPYIQLTMIERDFSRIGEIAVPMLIQAYGYSNSPNVYAEISSFLSKFRMLLEVPVRETIEMQDVKSQIGAILLVSIFKMKALLPQLLSALKDQNSEVRRAAAVALGQIGDKSVLSKILVSLKDVDNEVRQAAATALVQIADRSVIPKLVKELKNKNSNVRRAVLAALGHIGDEGIIPDLEVALKDKDIDVQRAAAAALVQVTDSNIISDLRIILRDSDSDIKQAITAALGQVGNASAVPDLLAVLKSSDSDMKRAAAAALGQIGDAGAVPDLLAILKSNDSGLWEAAAKALGQIGGASAVPDLLVLLRKGHASEAVADALGKIKSPQSVEPLGDLLYQSFDVVARAARTSLEEMNIKESKRVLAEWKFISNG